MQMLQAKLTFVGNDNMKIAIITRHAVSNYGSLLQTIATQLALKQLGHSCEIIDYIRDDETCWEVEKTLLKGKPKWNSSVLKRWIYLMLRQPESVIAGMVFARERKKYLLSTKRYSSYEQLVHDKPKADVYMTGSDQVWGPVADGTFDKAYMLAFTEDVDRRISYASSFGHTNMTKQLAHQYKCWLSRYTAVTVRERSAKKLLENLEILSEQVLDPTLLMEQSYWEQFACKKSPARYVLVYQIHNNPQVDAYAKKVARAKGVPLYRISTSLRRLKCDGKAIWLPDLKSFVGYIAGAECLVTDSFHGTAFAINLNVPFVDVLTENGTQSRNISILEMTGLTDRILRDSEDVRLADVPIDYQRINRILTQKRQESFAILDKMLQE